MILEKKFFGCLIVCIIFLSNITKINMNNKIDLNKKNRDETFGGYNEERLLKYLNKNVSSRIRKDNDPFAILDYYKLKNDKISKYYELKTRRYYFKSPLIQEEGLFFGANKFKRACDCNRVGLDVWFYFLMKDGLYGWALYDFRKQRGEYTFRDIANEARNDKTHDGILIKPRYIQLLDPNFRAEELEPEFLPDTDDEN